MIAMKLQYFSHLYWLFLYSYLLVLYYYTNQAVLKKKKAFAINKDQTHILLYYDPFISEGIFSIHDLIWNNWLIMKIIILKCN